ncbi:hypothetical protein IFR05_006476 [Cadophora sp. M221]|nr:hypothetical protein IFR05_006476 [Cadophora sp. M221]
MSHTMPVDANPKPFDDGCTPGQRAYLQHLDTLPYPPDLVDWSDVSEEKKGHWEAMGVDQLTQVEVEDAVRADLARRHRRDEDALWGAVGDPVKGVSEIIKEKDIKKKDIKKKDIKTKAVLGEKKVKAARVRKKQLRQQGKGEISQQIRSARPTDTLTNTSSAHLSALVPTPTSAAVSAPILVSKPMPTKAAVAKPTAIPVSAPIPSSTYARIPMPSPSPILNQNEYSRTYSYGNHIAATQKHYISPYACLPSIARGSGPLPPGGPAHENGFEPMSGVSKADVSGFETTLSTPNLLPEFKSHPRSELVFERLPSSDTTHIPGLNDIQSFPNPYSTPSQTPPQAAFQSLSSTVVTDLARNPQNKPKSTPQLFIFTHGSLNGTSTKPNPKAKPTPNIERAAIVSRAQTALGTVPRTGLSSEVVKTGIADRVNELRPGRHLVQPPPGLDDNSSVDMISVGQLLASITASSKIKYANVDHRVGSNMERGRALGRRSGGEVVVDRGLVGKGVVDKGGVNKGFVDRGVGGQRDAVGVVANEARGKGEDRGIRGLGEGMGPGAGEKTVKMNTDSGVATRGWKEL